MARFLKIYLVITAVLAVLSFVLGTFFSIVSLLFPLFGLAVLALMITPTLFLYGTAFAAVWFSARSRLGVRGAFLAGCAAVTCLGGLPPLLVNDDLENEVARVRADDERPSDPVAVTGVLRIEHGRDAVLPRLRREDGSERLACNELCAAALFTPGVEAVVVAFADVPVLMTVSGGDHLTAAYRLRRGDCPEPLLPQAFGRSGFGEWPDAPSLHTSHLLALARGLCLMLDDAIPAADWTLRLTRETLHGVDWRLSGDGGRLRTSAGSFDLLGVMTQTRLSLDTRGTRTLQQTQVDTQPLAAPLFGAASGGYFGARFRWFRRGRTDGRFEPIEVIARATRLRLSPTTAPTGEAIRDALAAALADPTLPAGAAGFGLFEALIRMMKPFDAHPDVRPGDAALIGRAIADIRMRDNLSGIVLAIRALGSSVEDMRAPMIARLLSVRMPEDRSAAENLGQALAYFPPGTFATLTPDEERLLADPVRRRWATGLIERQADRGAAATAELVGIIAQAYTRQASEADRALEWRPPDDGRAALRALCLIGPVSGDGFAGLAKLIETGAVPRSVLDNQDWQFTLARLSGAIEGVTRIGEVSASRQPHKLGPWLTLTQFEPENCR